MQLFQSFILLIIGFVFLIKGADFFVDGSASIAKQLRVPSLIVGMTVVAMGTSLPECSVSVTASLAGNNSLAISNVVGSNIFNLLVVCGAVISMIASANVKRSFQKNSRVYNQRGLRAEQVAEMILRSAGITDVSIRRVSGDLTDHYDPRESCKMKL